MDGAGEVKKISDAEEGSGKNSNTWVGDLRKQLKCQGFWSATPYMISFELTIWGIDNIGNGYE